MSIFLLTSFSKNISKIDLIGIILGHIIFGIALTQLLDWTWLNNLMSEKETQKMLAGYGWKDLLVDSAIIVIFSGIIFIITSLLL